MYPSMQNKNVYLECARVNGELMFPLPVVKWLFVLRPVKQLQAESACSR